MLFKDYKPLSPVVKRVIGAEFCIQLVNASFMTLLPLFMARRGYSNDAIALHIMFRFLGVFVLALPVGRYIRKTSPMPLFVVSTICVPLFGMASVFCIKYALDTLSIWCLLFWGASFTLMQIPVIPFILDQSANGLQTAALSLSYSTWSFGGIVSGLLIACLQAINSELFSEQTLLLLFSAMGLCGLFFIWSIRRMPQRSIRGYIAKINYKQNQLVDYY